jgi:hypothetical protein
MNFIFFILFLLNFKKIFTLKNSIETLKPLKNYENLSLNKIISLQEQEFIYHCFRGLQTTQSTFEDFVNAIFLLQDSYKNLKWGVKEFSLEQQKNIENLLSCSEIINVIFKHSFQSTLSDEEKQMIFNLLTNFPKNEVEKFLIALLNFKKILLLTKSSISGYVTYSIDCNYKKMDVEDKAFFEPIKKIFKDIENDYPQLGLSLSDIHEWNDLFIHLQEIYSEKNETDLILKNKLYACIRGYASRFLLRQFLTVLFNKKIDNPMIKIPDDFIEDMIKNHAINLNFTIKGIEYAENNSYYFKLMNLHHQETKHTSQQSFIDFWTDIFEKFFIQK